MKKMFFDVLLRKLFYKEKVHKFQQIYGKMGGVANREQPRGLVLGVGGSRKTKSRARPRQDFFT